MYVGGSCEWLERDDMWLVSDQQGYAMPGDSGDEAEKVMEGALDDVDEVLSRRNEAAAEVLCLQAK